jgi:hypothetical protein
MDDGARGVLAPGRQIQDAPPHGIAKDVECVHQPPTGPSTAKNAVVGRAAARLDALLGELQAKPAGMRKPGNTGDKRAVGTNLQSE